MVDYNNNTELVSIENKLKKWIQQNISDITFDKFVDFCRKETSEPAHTISQLNLKNNTKKIGDYFEAFTKLYFKHIKKYKNIWLMSELPDEIRNHLSLDKKDYGIDLIGIDTNNEYVAIQCKYRRRQPNKKLQGVSWKELSTFYALVYRTGPYFNHIVMTNLDYVRHIGKKNNKDISICYGTLKNLKFYDWFLMSEAQSLEQIVSDNTTQEDNTKDITLLLGPLEFIREKRLKFFEKLN